MLCTRVTGVTKINMLHASPSGHSAPFRLPPRGEVLSDCTCVGEPHPSTIPCSCLLELQMQAGTATTRGLRKVLLCEATVTFLLDIFLARNGRLLLALLFLKGKVTIVPGGFFPAGCPACCGSASAGSLVGSAARVYCVVCRERMPSGGSYVAQIIEAFVR